MTHLSEQRNQINYLRRLFSLYEKAIQQEEAKETPDEGKIKQYTAYQQALAWAISRLDPHVRSDRRIPSNARHLHNTKTYSITMSPEDHDRLVRLGKELHINGGFSGVLTYIAQNCVLIHE